MALKSKEWFYKQCLIEVREFSPFTHLCWRALEIGVGQIHGTRGHCTQAIGAIQNFLDAFPAHVPTIRGADRTQRFEIDQHAQMLQDWTGWFQQQAGVYGQPDFGYNYDTLRGYLTPALGGNRGGGGGGDDEFKLILRLVPEFLGRT